MLGERKRAIIEAANQRFYANQANIKEVDKLSEETDSSRTLIIKSMHGLGDNINQRAFIKELGRECFIDTPWPQLYRGLDFVKFIKCSTHLRTQIKNVARLDFTNYVQPPVKDLTVLRVFYTTKDLQTGSQLKRFWQQFAVKPKVFDLPDFGKPEFWNCHPLGERKVAVVRPATLRKEWTAASRNPDPQYIYQASKILKDLGYFVVSVADTEPDIEWIIGQEPEADIKFHRGELSVEALLGLVQNADLSVGGHGWLTHACLSYKKPMFWIGGGYGGDNSPNQIADPNFVDPSLIQFCLPDNYCKCSLMVHPCDKHISNFEDKFTTWVRSLG